MILLLTYSNHLSLFVLSTFIFDVFGQIEEVLFGSEAVVHQEHFLLISLNVLSRASEKNLILHQNV